MQGATGRRRTLGPGALLLPEPKEGIMNGIIWLGIFLILLWVAMQPAKHALRKREQTSPGPLQGEGEGPGAEPTSPTH